MHKELQHIKEKVQKNWLKVVGPLAVAMVCGLATLQDTTPTYADPGSPTPNIPGLHIDSPIPQVEMGKATYYEDNLENGSSNLVKEGSFSLKATEPIEQSTKETVILACSTPDSPGDEETLSTARSMFIGESYGKISSYFSTISNGNARVNSRYVSSAWAELTKNRWEYYKQDGTFDYVKFIADCTEKYDPSVNFSHADILAILSSFYGGAALGGGITLPSSHDGETEFRFVYFPKNVMTEKKVAVVVHEFGHTWGLGHANLAIIDSNGNIQDVHIPYSDWTTPMGDYPLSCPIYLDIGCPAQWMTAFNLLQANWLPNSQKAVVAQNSGGVFSLAYLDNNNPGPASIKVIEIQGEGKEKFSVETRRSNGVSYDRGLYPQTDGAFAHYMKADYTDPFPELFLISRTRDGRTAQIGVGEKLTPSMNISICNLGKSNAETTIIAVGNGPGWDCSRIIPVPPESLTHKVYLPFGAKRHEVKGEMESNTAKQDDSQDKTPSALHIVESKDKKITIYQNGQKIAASSKDGSFIEGDQHASLVASGLIEERPKELVQMGGQIFSLAGGLFKPFSQN